MRTASGIRIYKLNAYAKLNLYLDITGRRDDGYHLLETVMQSISLADEVTVVVSAGNGITLSVSREDIPTDGRNTAYRAAELFLEKRGLPARSALISKSVFPAALVWAAAARTLRQS